MSEKKIIYYYQTNRSLSCLLNDDLHNVYMYISSIHFGQNENKKLYIHLNDQSPYEQKHIWFMMRKATDKGLHVLLMLGGAGGGFKTLFSNYTKCYSLLKKLIQKYSFIRGVDLDIEEGVDIGDVETLISDLVSDFGQDFIITLAPIQSSLIFEEPGLGGFKYKDLLKSSCGSSIHWLNVQAYNDYSSDSYSKIIQKGYDSKKIVYGMLGDALDKDSFPTYCAEIKNIVKEYPSMGGVFLWEYGDTNIEPIYWKDKMFDCLYSDMISYGKRKSKKVYKYIRNQISDYMNHQGISFQEKLLDSWSFIKHKFF